MMSYKIITLLFVFLLVIVSIKFWLSLDRAENQFSHYTEWAAKTPEFLRNDLEVVLEGERLSLLYSFDFQRGLHKEHRAKLHGFSWNGDEKRRVLDVSILIRKTSLGHFTEMVICTEEEHELDSYCAAQLFSLARKQFPTGSVLRKKKGTKTKVPEKRKGTQLID